MRIKLTDIHTRAPEGLDKKTIKKETRKLAEEIGELQITLMAEERHALLVVFQGMDASGKDGSMKAALPYCNPIGLKATSFKKPTEIEMHHDFLWRIHQHAPARGMIHVFNRSHYEDILIQRVNNWIDEDQVQRRMKYINQFEELLRDENNTTILKFYLHISREEQRNELWERIEEREKNWKHKAADWEEASKWEEYRDAYEYAINQSRIPWNIIPADQAWYRNFLVAKTVRDTLAGLDMVRPVLSEKDILTMREIYGGAP
ncbi:MAG TPA: PPK2 family polyphosphate kinase [Membranihabitans sp.]|nr:PPK2 family polyphosphate kinase [Membranihabitans sp.]